MCNLQVAFEKAVIAWKRMKIYLILFDPAYPVATKTQLKSGMPGIYMAMSTYNLKMSLFSEGEEWRQVRLLGWYRSLVKVSFPL